MKRMKTRLVLASAVVVLLSACQGQDGSLLQDRMGATSARGQATTTSVETVAQDSVEDAAVAEGSLDVEVLDADATVDTDATSTSSEVRGESNKVHGRIAQAREADRDMAKAVRSAMSKADPTVKSQMLEAAKRYLTARGDSLLASIDRLSTAVTTSTEFSADEPLRAEYLRKLNTLKQKITRFQSSAGAATGFTTIRVVRRKMRDLAGEYRTLAKAIRGSVVSLKTGVADSATTVQN